MRSVWRSALLLVVFGCGGADRSLDVDALTARDLLGVEPAIAMSWDDDQRQRAAETVAAAASAGGSEVAPLGYAADPASAILASLTEIDYRRAGAGDDVIAFARAEVSSATPAAVKIEAARPDRESRPALEIVGSGWPESLASLLRRDPDRIAAIAVASGHPVDETLFVSPAAQEPFATLYLGDRKQLLINPVYLVTLEPVAEPLAAAAIAGGRVSSPRPRQAANDGNPYSFFGSIAECAADERLRCEACLGSGTCDSVTRDSADGNAECEAFAAENGRGYFLFCANLSAAIATVADCIEERASACPVNREAGNLLSALQANAALLDDPACLEAADSCLTDIFGPPDGDFPDFDPDAPPPPPPPPRPVEFSCYDNEVDCDFAPQVGCSSEGCASGPSCGGCDGGCEGGGCNSSCDGGSGCDDSSGCDSGSCEGGSCDGCSNSGCEGGGCESDCGGSSDSGGGCGGSGDSGGGCGGSSDSGGGCGGSSDGGGSCGGSSDSGGGCGGGSSGGGSCGGGSSGGGSSCGGGGSSGGSCGGGSSGGGSSCGGSGGGGGGSQCAVARRRGGGWGAPLFWALFPLLMIGRMRQRERRRRHRCDRT